MRPGQGRRFDDRRRLVRPLVAACVAATLLAGCKTQQVITRDTPYFEDRQNRDYALYPEALVPVGQDGPFERRLVLDEQDDGTVLVRAEQRPLCNVMRQPVYTRTKHRVTIEDRSMTLVVSGLLLVGGGVATWVGAGQIADAEENEHGEVELPPAALPLAVLGSLTAAGGLGGVMGGLGQATEAEEIERYEQTPMHDMPSAFSRTTVRDGEGTIIHGNVPCDDGSAAPWTPVAVAPADVTVLASLPGRAEAPIPLEVLPVEGEGNVGVVDVASWRAARTWRSACGNPTVELRAETTRGLPADGVHQASASVGTDTTPVSELPQVFQRPVDRCRAASAAACIRGGGSEETCRVAVMQNPDAQTAEQIEARLVTHRQRHCLDLQHHTCEQLARETKADWQRRLYLQVAGDWRALYDARRAHQAEMADLQGEIDSLDQRISTERANIRKLRKKVGPVW